MSAHKLDEQAKGVFIISATPFTEQGALDLESTSRLVDFYLDKRVNGITILGMMGEAPKLSSEESVIFLSHVLDQVGGRVPVIVGVSNPGLENLVELARKSRDRGAAGVMIAPPLGLSPDERIYHYFEQVFSALGEDIPVVYQDYPFATRAPISASTFNRMVIDFPRLVMLKHEEWPGLGKLSQIRAASNLGLRRVSILVGNGGLYLPQELARGADGAMTGFAYPEMLVKVIELHQDGEIARAEDLFDLFLPLVRHEQQPGFGLALRKEILRRRGVLSSAKVRAPGPSLNSTDLEELTRLTQRVESKLKDF